MSLLSRFGGAGDGDRVASALQSHFGLAPSGGWAHRELQRHLPENATLQAIPAALAKAGMAWEGGGRGLGWWEFYGKWRVYAGEGTM